MTKMTKKEAERRAEALWGPTASAIHRSAKDRHERYLLAFISPLERKPVIVGWGDCFENAFERAKENLAAKEQERLVQEAREWYEKLTTNQGLKEVAELWDEVDKLKEQEEKGHGSEGNAGQEDEGPGGEGQGVEAEREDE